MDYNLKWETVSTLYKFGMTRKRNEHQEIQFVGIIPMKLSEGDGVGWGKELKVG